MMDNEESFDSQDIAPGLSAEDIRQVARRQLAASTATAMFIAAMAILAAVSPTRYQAATGTPHRTLTIHTPSFVIPGPQRTLAFTRQRRASPLHQDSCRLTSAEWESASDSVRANARGLGRAMMLSGLSEAAQSP
jgi:hypothetical protein